MKKIRTSILILLCTNACLAQSPTEILSWLKSNIKINYILNPNLKGDTAITPIKTTTITSASQGIIFGKSTNNEMDLSAQLLIALFKGTPTDAREGILKNENGDPEFQRSVYYAMQISRKPMTVFFINDLVNPIDPTKTPDYRMYLFANTQVYPGLFKMDQSSAGAMVVGQAYFQSIDRYKEMFLTMTARLSLGDYGPGKTTQVIKVKDSEPFVFGTNDIRGILNQGVANAFLLNYSSQFRSDIDLWEKAGYFFLYNPDGEVSADEKARITVPKEYSLNEVILKIDADQRPYNSSTFAGKIPDNILKKVFIRSDFQFMAFGEPERFKFMSDMHIGIMCYQFIRKFGLNKFVDCLRFNNSELLKANYSQKLFILYKNMCTAMLNGKTIETLEKDAASQDLANAMFPLGVFHLYGFKSPKSIFENEFITKTGVTLQNVPDPFRLLIGHYQKNWLDKVSTVVKADIPAGPGFTKTESKINAIANVLRIK